LERGWENYSGIFFSDFILISRRFRFDVEK